MPVEDTAAQWAQHIVTRALNRPVELHDTNKLPGMFDLRIGPVDAPDMAIEVVGAVDSVYTETWNHGPARGPLQLDIRGDWMVIITPNTRLRTFRQEIEPLLQQLEARSLYTLRPAHFLSQEEEDLLDDLWTRGIQHAWCYRMEGSGFVHMTLPGSGGVVDEAGAALPMWISEFLRAPQRADVLEKLGRSGAPHREVFIIATLRGTPWPVEGYLTGSLDQLPIAVPDLPDPITGVWIVSSFPCSGRGVRWDDDGWHIFSVGSVAHPDDRDR
jgi:hypothetical protein